MSVYNCRRKCLQRIYSIPRRCEPRRRCRGHCRCDAFPEAKWLRRNRKPRLRGLVFTTHEPGQQTYGSTHRLRRLRGLRRSLGLGSGTDRYFPKPPKYTPEPQPTSKRAKSDEHYVLKLCNEVLGSGCEQQRTFDWLLGLPSKKTGLRAPLPVDGYWEDRRLVVEYHEKQHSEAVPFFDDKVTASGHLRGEQRKLYDAQKATMIPEQGLTLLIIDYRDFQNVKGKIVRNYEKDLLVVARMIKDVLPQPVGDQR